MKEKFINRVQGVCSLPGSSRARGFDPISFRQEFGHRLAARFKAAPDALFETASHRIQKFPMRRALKKPSIFRGRLPHAATLPNLSYIGRKGPPPEHFEGGM
jgi:hypothetical protein